MAQAPVKLYICYAPSNQTALSSLKKSLSFLERSGTIQFWSRDTILAGGNYDQQIVAHLDQTQIIIMLVSSSLLASEYYEGVEMTHALQLHQEGRARLIPVILEHCMWKETPPLGALKPLPEGGKPAGRNDKAWAAIGVGINLIVAQIQKEQAEKEPDPPASPTTKSSGKSRKPARPKAQPLSGAALTIENPRANRAPAPVRPLDIPLKSEPVNPALLFGAEFEPATPEARAATPAFDQNNDRLQSEINQIVFDILVWEPAQSAHKLVADERRAIYHSLQDKHHQCKLGTELPPPPAGMSLQDREIDQARAADMTILLVEAPAIVEMYEFCSDYNEVLFEKTLCFYPEKKEPSSGNRNIDEMIFDGYHLHYYQEEDIIDCRVRTKVLKWVESRRGCRYRNLRRRGR